MAISEGGTLGFPLGSPQHGRKVKAGVDDDTICVRDLKKGIGSSIKNVRKVIATGKRPFLQLVILGDLVAQRQGVVHIYTGR